MGHTMAWHGMAQPLQKHQALLVLEKLQSRTIFRSEAALGGPSPALEGNQLKRAVTDVTKARQSTYSCFQANM